MSRNFKELGNKVYIDNYNSEELEIQLETLLKRNNYNIVYDYYEADSIIHIPQDNQFKLSYNLKDSAAVNIFLNTNHSEEDIFLAYVKKKTNELKIYPFNLDKNIGISENALELNGNSIVKPNFNNSFEELLWNCNQLTKQKQTI